MTIQRVNTRSIGRALVGAALVAGSVSGCNYADSIATNPNTVPTAAVDQLLTAVQVNTFFLNEGEISRLSAMWLQQLRGAERQFSALNQYSITENDGDDAWGGVYRHGGLNEIRKGIALANEQNRPITKGIFQIYEAFDVGLAADVWGDVPYSEAVNPEIQTPKLDPQLQVYDQLQSLLDDAIKNLQANSGKPTSGVDLNFNGDAAKWIPVAHSLKARLYMHVAEVQGNAAYQKAYDQAQMGIKAVSGNWTAIHTSASTENNVWYQFQRDRSGYIVPNSTLASYLNSKSDPRLTKYFDEIKVQGGSAEANSIAIPATQSYNQPILTCSENYFILAEAALKLGRQADARQALANALKCQEAYWSVKLDYVNPAAVPASELLTTIMYQKWIALFLNPETWNDYKRTCLPNITPVASIAGRKQIPPGLYYPISERQTNPNIPEATPATLRNPNDPNPCP